MTTAIETTQASTELVALCDLFETAAYAPDWLPQDGSLEALSTMIAERAAVVRTALNDSDTDKEAQRIG